MKRKPLVCVLFLLFGSFVVVALEYIGARKFLSYNKVYEEYFRLRKTILPLLVAYVSGLEGRLEE